MDWTAYFDAFSSRQRAIAGLRKLGRDRGGSALLYMTVSLPALMGFALLTIDASRFMNLHSSLQNAADALALAAAGELDRLPDACNRAVTAMTNLVDNAQRFGTAGFSGITIDDVSYRFLTELPVNDSDPIPSSMELSPCEDLHARFIEVTIDPQGFVTLFPAGFVGADPSVTASATAVAGFDFAICKFAPIFICNPYEPAGNTDLWRSAELVQHVANPANLRKQFEMKKHDSGSGMWSPGNYGYLEANFGPGANALGEAIASKDPPICFLQSGIYTKPGNTTVSRNAFNVRFDIYKGSYSSSNVNYPPAPNVRKGFTYSPSCAGSQTPAEPPNMGLPRDRCFNDTIPGPCAETSRIGLGDWDEDNNGTPDFEDYWTTNFGGTPLPQDENGLTYSNTRLPSRYTIYKYEIENNLLDIPTDPGATSEEQARPYCHVDAATSVNPKRRLITGAIINCIAQPIAVGNSGGPYAAVAFGDFFLTEPMGVNDTQDSLWVELVDIVVTNETSSRAKDLVQLYR